MIPNISISQGFYNPVVKPMENINSTALHEESKTTASAFTEKLANFFLLLKGTCSAVIPGIAEKIDPETKEKTELVNRTIKAINQEMLLASTGSEEQRMVAIASRLASKLNEFIPKLKTLPAPGCCYYTGKDYLKNVVAIAEKQERVENAMIQLKATPSENPKVDEYFQNALMKLKKGENVPLPDFYHATRAGLEGIITSQTIRQSSGGAAGPGTYMSCNNEGDLGYGPHAFAIDEGCLVDTSANTFTGRQPNGNVFYSVWAAVLKDIPVTDETIAFIDTNEDIQRVTDLLKKQNLNIPVIDRQTSDEILRIFDLSTKRREFPSFGWKKSQYLPKNMYLRSVQGTFRQFAPAL